MAMRILFVEHKPAMGGGQIALLNLLKRFLKHDIAFDVIIPQGSPLSSELDKRGILFQELDLGRIIKSSNPFVMIRNVIERIIPSIRMCGIIRSRKISCIYANGTYSFIAVLLVAKLTKTPVIWVVHNTTLPMSGVTRYLMKVADRIITVTNVIKEQFMELLPGVETKIEVIYNGVDTEEYRCRQLSDVSALKKQLGMPERAFVVGTVGRLSSEKGQDCFIKAIVGVEKVFPDMRCLIIGDGPLKQNLLELAERLGVAGKIFFPGFRTDIANIYSVMDLFVLPSVNEALPLSLLEAMAAERTVIASDVGGVSEIVIPDRTGMLVPSSQPEILAEAIVHLMRKKDRLSEMGRLGRSTVKEHFNIERSWFNTIEVIKNIRDKDLSGTNGAVIG